MDDLAARAREKLAAARAAKDIALEVDAAAIDEYEQVMAKKKDAPPPIARTSAVAAPSPVARTSVSTSQVDADSTAASTVESTDAAAPAAQLPPPAADFHGQRVDGSFCCAVGDCGSSIASWTSHVGYTMHMRLKHNIHMLDNTFPQETSVTE